MFDKTQLVGYQSAKILIHKSAIKKIRGLNRLIKQDYIRQRALRNPV